MISGHLGIAAAALGRRDEVLDFKWMAVFGAATFLPDAVDLILSLIGVCNPSGLYSHTLPVVAVLTAIAGGGVWLASGRRSDAMLAMLLVMVHLPADFVTGRKLFWPGGELHGWRLYQRPVADFALETMLLIGGYLLLDARRRAPGRRISIGLLVLTIATQISYDVVAGRGSTLKPNACIAGDASALP